MKPGWLVWGCMGSTAHRVSRVTDQVDGIWACTCSTLLKGSGPIRGSDNVSLPFTRESLPNPITAQERIQEKWVCNVNSGHKIILEVGLLSWWWMLRQVGLFAWAYWLLMSTGTFGEGTPRAASMTGYGHWRAKNFRPVVDSAYLLTGAILHISPSSAD